MEIWCRRCTEQESEAAAVTLLFQMQDDMALFHGMSKGSLEGGAYEKLRQCPEVRSPEMMHVSLTLSITPSIHWAQQRIDYHSRPPASTGKAAVGPASHEFKAEARL